MINVLKIRTELGWTREKLADKLGVSYFTIQNWELGHNEPSPMAIRIIQDLLKKQVEEVPDGT